MRTLASRFIPALAVGLAASTVLPTGAPGQEPANDRKPPTLEEAIRSGTFGSDRARNTVRNFPSRGARSDGEVPPRSADETVASFRLMDGLEARSVLQEPVVRQPVFLNFDERGRLWVVQFLQYPYPAGVKIVDFDDQFHAVYDRVPPPPPHHDRGADRITIHSDEDSDGVFETHEVFLDGLNMATSVERGRGGVWVLQPPYLLFYPDTDGDDVPDGDPRVHLAGFGLEDTHSASNSLRWGPDGWLYGGQGSGCSSTIRRPGVDEDDDGLYFKGQVIWRYHPERRVFELFAEGGGNTFSVEIDAAGRVYSGINGSDGRGVHFVQGGYYEKNFGEHGYLTNPYAYGFFRRMSHDRPTPRFSHTFVIYEDGALGPRLAGRLIAPVPLRHEIVVSELLPEGSTFRTHDVGKLVESNDPWFRPVDIKVGPDGAIYVADWYDTRLTHMDPRDTWDRERGRIYRLRARGSRPAEPFDLSTESSARLVERLRDPRKWYRQTALRVLGDRRDRSVIPLLRERVTALDEPHGLDALWALNLVGGFTLDTVRRLLSHPDAALRTWTLRLLGDRPRNLDGKTVTALVSLAAVETDPGARSQLAATARRLDATARLPIVFAMLRGETDVDDPHVPLLVWWALERSCESSRERIREAFDDESLWSEPLVRGHILGRLARRFAARPTPRNQAFLASLLRAAPDAESRRLLLDGVREAFKGGSSEALASVLIETLLGDSAASNADPATLELRLRGGDRRALAIAVGRIAGDTQINEVNRIRLVDVVGELGLESTAPVLLEVLGRPTTRPIRSASLTALGRLAVPDLTREVLSRWSALDKDLRQQALGILASRKTWARQLLDAVGGAGVISKSDVPDELVDRIRLLGDAGLDSLVERHFGKRRSATTDEKRRRTAGLVAMIRKGPAGDRAAGREVFTERCARCHRLFGEGSDIGPDLTPQERANLENMLLQIVDPSAGIREGYTQFVLTTTDGSVLTGWITAREADRIELRDPTTGKRQIIAKDRIADETTLKTSLMPEGLLDGLEESAVRDLMAYFMGTAR